MENFNGMLSDKTTLSNAVPTGSQSDQWNFLTKNDISVSINESHCIIEDGKQQWKCHMCPKIYTRKHNLVTHIMSHAGIKPFSCNDCGKSFRQITHLQTHMTIHQQNKNHKCEHCGRSFSQLTHLKRHLLLHLDKKPYTCEVCSRGFAYPSELRKHLDKHREADECRECGKEIPPDKMEQHMINKHLLMNKKCHLTCESCNQEFSYPAGLQDHIENEHKDDLKHKCDKCPMKFLAATHLKAHLLTHKATKMYSCIVCGRGFSQKGNMERHMLIHSKERQFECKTCGKKFTQLQVLKMHQISHSTSKPFTCTICGKTLARNHNLKAHLALHMNKKPYKCGVCNNSFTLKGNLYRHQKEKHGRVIRVSKDKMETESDESDFSNGSESTINMEKTPLHEDSGTIPLSLLHLQASGDTTEIVKDIEMNENTDNVSFGKLGKRRKGSPKRLRKDSGSLSPPLSSPSTPNDSITSNIPCQIGTLPNSPEKPGSLCTEPIHEDHTASGIQNDLMTNASISSVITSGLSPVVSSDFLFSSSFSSGDLLSSPYYGSPSSNAFPHLPTSYPSQTAVSNLRPLIPNDISHRHYSAIDLGNPSGFLPLTDGYGMVPRTNDSMSVKLQFVHGEIDELVNKLESVPSDKVNALHVAVNELAGLHMSLSPSFPDTTATFLT